MAVLDYGFDEKFQKYSSFIDVDKSWAAVTKGDKFKKYKPMPVDLVRLKALIEPYIKQ